MSGYYRELQAYGAEGWGVAGKAHKQIINNSKKSEDTEKLFNKYTC